MDRMRKITVRVPEALLEAALRRTDRGLAETVREGLRLVAADSAYRRLRGLRGRVRIGLDVEALRDDGSRAAGADQEVETG